jgi:hypothetical protein
MAGGAAEVARESFSRKAALAGQCSVAWKPVLVLENSSHWFGTSDVLPIGVHGSALVLTCLA